MASYDNFLYDSAEDCPEDFIMDEPPYENDRPTEAELEEMAAMRHSTAESIYSYLKAHPEYD